MAHNTAAYLGDEGAPGSIQKHIADIQASGLTTVILIALHVGRKMKKYPDMNIGDLMYNHYPDGLLVSGGKFNPKNNSAIAVWPGQVAQLKQQGSVRKVFISVGGQGGYNQERDVFDFRTIQKMFTEGKEGILRDNIAALKAAFTINRVCAIDGFDIDCEEKDVGEPGEKVDENTIVKFCQILFEHEFAVTFCPYESDTWWRDCMQKLWKQGHKVSWWNLQCYAGGSGNQDDLSPWYRALSAVVYPQAPASFLVPGLAVKSAKDVLPETDRLCPTGPKSFYTTFRGLNNPRLAGGFLWNYDALVGQSTVCSGQNHLSAYVQAITGALAPHAP
jgi:hypothetical protein